MSSKPIVSRTMHTPTKFFGLKHKTMIQKQQSTMKLFDSYSWENKWEVKAFKKQELNDLLAGIVASQLGKDVSELKNDTAFADLDADR
jgi:hypothetical protein